MFALRHKFTGTYMYQTYETDNWGNNAVIRLIEEKDIPNYQYEGTTVYVQQHVDAVEKLFIQYELNKKTHDEYIGTFSEPVLYVPLEEYEIVELEISLQRWEKF